jgi:hypothetical protein
LKRWIAFILGLSTLSLSLQAEPFPAPGRWALMGYYGRTTSNTLGQVIGLDCELEKEHLYSLEASYVFPKNSKVVTYFGEVFGRLELAGNFTVHDDVNGTIFEFVPYFCAGYNNFPWNHYVLTTISIGEGISYISDIPACEFHNSNDPRKLLNYLMFEISLGRPSYHNYQFVFRIHHRSGVFGLYNASNSGATAIGVGFRVYIN